MFGTGFRQLVDKNDLDFPMSSILEKQNVKLISRHHAIGKIMNQGQTSSCVGHACKLLLTSEPFVQTGPSPFVIYREARVIDEFPDDETEGTSIRAGLNVLRNKGFIKSYYWAKTTNDVIKYLLNYGPVVAGTSWFQNMFYPDNFGFVDPKGSLDHEHSGHAYLITGVNIKKGYFVGANSWGQSWGINGQFKIKISDFGNLIKNGGAVAGVIEK